MTTIQLLDQAASALSNMIDLADAWATCGPETYTKSERKRRDAAEKTLGKLVSALFKSDYGWSCLDPDHNHATKAEADACTDQSETI
jgi:hypothetical protein